MTDLRIFFRDGVRIPLQEAKQGDTLKMYENENDLAEGIGKQWHLQSDAFMPDLSKGIWACIGTISDLED